MVIDVRNQAGGVLTPAQRALMAQLEAARRMTLTELCTATGLPRSTAANSIARLLDNGLVREHDPIPSTRGRPSRTYSLTVAPGPIAVVVAAAHGTLVGIIELDGRVLAQVEGETLAGDADSRMPHQALASLDEAIRSAGIAAGDLSLAVVGLPGPSRFDTQPADPSVSQDLGQLWLRRFQLWGGAPADRVISRHLGRPTYSENDANLGALGEAMAGAGADSDVVLFVNLAYGTGGGLVIHGRPHRGRSRLAGEIGHLHTDDGGQLCVCGARGCFWQTRSIPALLDELAATHHRPFTLADIRDAAERDEPDVVRALVGFGHALGRHLADAVVFIDPDVVVLDGALGAAAQPIADGVRESVNRYAPPAMARGVQIMPGKLGTAAALHGAAALAHREGLIGQVIQREPLHRS
jgi:predicted NBD/HSP70 family sugar kinase